MKSRVNFNYSVIKTIKYLEVDFVQVRAWDIENYKDSMKQIKKDTINGEKSFSYCLEYLKFQDAHATKSYTQI